MQPQFHKIGYPILKHNLAFFKQYHSTLLESRNIAGFRESGGKYTHKGQAQSLDACDL